MTLILLCHSLSNGSHDFILASIQNSLLYFEHINRLNLDL